nr:hypothetical protein [Tanacetum cinerariifolium]
HTIKYALVVNPTIYVSCIKKFWATATVKKVNGDIQLRALTDGKKVVVSEAIIRRDIHLDDANWVECLPNREIFKELARMGYEKPPPKLTFYKVFFFTQWKFLIYNLVQRLSTKRTARNEFSCYMASAVICLATGRKFNFSKYIFNIMVRNVDSPSKFLMYLRFLQVVMDNQLDDMTSHNTRYTSSALTHKVFENMRRDGKGFSGVETPLFASMLVQPQPQVEKEVEIPIAPSPPALQDPTPTPHATPPQDQLSTPHDSPPQEQPTTPHESSMPLLTTLMETCATLSQKVTKLEQDKHSQALEILQLKMMVKRLERKKKSKHSGFQRLRKVGIAQRVKSSTHTVLGAQEDASKQEEVNAASKGVSAISAPELVSAVEPTVFDDEDIAQKLHDEEVLKATARDKQEKADMERALELQRQYDDKEENIDWSVVLEQVRHIFKREYKKVQTLFKLDKDVQELKKKRVADETLLQESVKKLRADEVLHSESTQEISSNDPKEIFKEDIQTMLEIIIRVGGITEAYQVLEDMLKGFDIEDLVALWNLIKEKFSSAMPGEDKEKALWVKLKRLFEPDADDVLWKLQRYMHATLTWKLYTDFGVHHVSSTRGNNIFMLTEKDYPLSNVVMILMLSGKLQVEEDDEMARDLVIKIFMEANKLKSKSLDISSK